jgi:N-formylglutamate amidohydrolase
MMKPTHVSDSFSIFPGHEGSSVILHVPHAGTHIPDAVRAGIVLTDAGVATELLRMTDSFTDVIADLGAQHAEMRPWIFRNNLSRLVIDPERFPDEREEMLTAGMGAVYTRASAGETLREESVYFAGSAAWVSLIGQYFDPYTQALQRLVNERMVHFDSVTIIDVHSFPSVALPYELHANLARPAICIGTDDIHSPPELVEQVAEAMRSVGSIGINEPFIGTYVPLEQYHVDPRVRSVMVEIRRDLYMDETTGVLDRQAAEKLGRALAACLV